MGLEKKQEHEHVIRAVQMQISLKHRAVMILLAQVSKLVFCCLLLLCLAPKEAALILSHGHPSYGTSRRPMVIGDNGESRFFI